MTSHAFPNTKGTVVLGSTSSDPHVVPLFLAKLMLEENGYQVVNLRCFNSPENFVSTAQSLSDIRAIVISNNNGAACEDLEGLSMALDQSQTKVPVILGGRAWLHFTPEIERTLQDLGITHICKDFDALLQTLDAMERIEPCRTLA